jgi:large subunit ribosomal protein L13
MKTFVPTPSDITRKWFVVDAENKVLGRLAVEVANILRGKNKSIFQPNSDTGDFVIVVNAEKIAVTGAKFEGKEYFVPSYHIGNSRNMTFRELKEKNPGKIVQKAVKGMLPHNPLGRKMGRKLFVYVGPNHNHQAQKPEVLDF